MKNFLRSFRAMFLAGLWLANQPAAIAAAAPSLLSTAFPVTITDGAGRTVKLAAAPRRIVSLSPAATDILVRVGAHAELVGITRYCTIPALDETHVQRLGGVLDADYEGLLALRPDLVIVPLLADKSMQEKLASLGLTFVVLHPEGLEGDLADIRMVGRATGHQENGQAIANNIEAIRALVLAREKVVPVEKRPRVLIRMEDNSPAPGSYVDDLLTAAGGRNALPRGPQAWVTVSPERILQLSPDLIVDIPLPDATGSPTQPPPNSIGKIPEKTLPNGTAFYRPGPDLGLALWQLARALYPNLFPETAPPAATAPIIR